MVVTRIRAGEIKLMVLLLITIICLLNDGSYTYLHPATRKFTAIDLSLCSPNIRMEIIIFYFLFKVTPVTTRD